MSDGGRRPRRPQKPRPADRGEAPDGTDPVVPPAAELPPYDPTRPPSEHTQRLIDRFGGMLRESKHSWFPHLLIRGGAGDSGERPLWEPTPCWLSPDIHVIPTVAGLDLSRAVASPVVGESYTVAVHIWNIAPFPADGVVVRAWWAEPGFFRGQPGYTPHFIGGIFTSLGDWDSSTAHRIVPIPTPWVVQDQHEAHECLIAVVECAADPWSGAFDPNGDRHVAQRNLNLIRGQADAAALLDTLGQRAQDPGELTVDVSGITRPPLRGASARGYSTSTDSSIDRGVWQFPERRRISTLTYGASGWGAAPMIPTLRRRPPADGVRLAQPAGPPIDRLARGDVSLAVAVAGVLGGQGTTAADLLGGREFAGAGSGAVHLGADGTGYTIMLVA